MISIFALRGFVQELTTGGMPIDQAITQAIDEHVEPDDRGVASTKLRQWLLEEQGDGERIPPPRRDAIQIGLRLGQSRMSKKGLRGRSKPLSSDDPNFDDFGRLAANDK